MHWRSYTFVDVICPGGMLWLPEGAHNSNREQIYPKYDLLIAEQLISELQPCWQDLFVCRSSVFVDIIFALSLIKPFNSFKNIFTEHWLQYPRRNLKQRTWTFIFGHWLFFSKTSYIYIWHLAISSKMQLHLYWTFIFIPHLRWRDMSRCINS